MKNIIFILFLFIDMNVFSQSLILYNGNPVNNNGVSVISTSTVPPVKIITDHTIVADYENIPQYYINEVKKMWMVYAGESHSLAIRSGLEALEIANATYQVNITDGTVTGGPTPESYTDQHLRASRATWGNYIYSNQWIYYYGESSWYTNTTGIARTKTGLTYCNTNGPALAALGYGWCWDMTEGSPTANADPVYGVHWYGRSVAGANGDKAWGLEAEDVTETGNAVSLDSYLAATQEYIDYCITNSLPTKVFFTTGTVDMYNTGENGYQSYLKNQRIRDYVVSNDDLILFDYADILCWDDNGTPTTTTWNGNTYPTITTTNLGDSSVGHIGSAGALRLAKAMWWMLARMAGWDGNP